MMTAARLTFRVYRFELLAILAYGLILGSLAIVVTIRMNDVNPGVACLRAWMTQASEAPGCSGVRSFFDRNEAEAAKVMAAMWLLPLVAGVVAGSVLVAREIEHRTAQFAWSVGPSRRRWYLDRVLPVLAVVLVATILPAIAADALEGARSPWLDPLASAGDFGLRGPIPVALAVAALGIGVLVGSVLGRMLPALIVAAIVVIVLHSAMAAPSSFGEPTVPLDPVSVQSGLDGSLAIGQAWRTSDGRLLSEAAALALAPAGSTSDDASLWVSAHFTWVPVGVPGDDVWRVEVRESALLLGLGGAALIAAYLVVRRRRPY